MGVQKCLGVTVVWLALSGCQPQQKGASPKTFSAQFCVERSLRRSTDPSIFPLAFSEFTKACEQGEQSACSSLGVMHELGLGTSEDHVQAHKLYETACAGKNVGGCTNLGLAALHGVGEAKSPARAKELLDWSCRHQHPTACRELGVMFLLGEGVAADALEAVKFFRMACKKADGEACYDVGVLYEQGISVNEDNAQALSFFEEACVNGDTRGCDGVERIRRDSATRVRERSAVKALPSEVACEAGQASECSAAGMAYFRGDSVKRDVAHSVLLLRRGCEGGDTTTCSLLEPMLQGSCSHGHDDSCAALKSLPLAGSHTKGSHGAADE